VWVRSDVSDRLGHLLAEQDDNAEHKPLTQVEAAGLYRELTQLMREDAERRQQWPPGSAPSISRVPTVVEIFHHRRGRSERPASRRPP
jgi:hypothetical protein